MLLESIKTTFVRIRAFAENLLIGCPESVIFFGHGIGDDLLCTAVARELKKREAGKLVIFSNHGSLFEHNPDIAAVYNLGYPTIGRRRYAGYNCIIPQFSDYDPESDTDSFQREHVITTMCRIAGITGGIELRPYLSLTPEERLKGSLLDRQVVIQSAGLASGPGVMNNKEWYPERFQEVVDQLRGEVSFVHLGSKSDPPIKGALDLRGKTSFRESAAILAASQLFIGLVGFPMHLARAVDCRSVILFGGREDPSVTGYSCNENLVGAMPCAPCWHRNRCEFDRECMRMIDAEQVVAAVRKQLAHHELPIEYQVIDLDSETRSGG
jgi:hypothetical protein